MKKHFLKISLAASLVFGFQTSQAQTFEDIFGVIFGNEGNTNNTQNPNNPNNPYNPNNPNTKVLGSGLSNLDISNGLKEALTIGGENASSRLSKTDGFFTNQMVKIMMPEEARRVESTLRQFGMGQLADQAILLMNRAAEDAVKKAGPIFVTAIRQMTLKDAINILRGGDNAATQYLQKATQQQLMAAFAPEIQKSLNKVGADRVWSQTFSAYNRFDFGQQKVNTDLTQYVTQKATEGMFKTIAEEEMKIRKNPISRTTELLRKVFGN